MMRVFSLFPCVPLLLAGIVSDLPGQTTRDLVGLWRLISCESRDSTQFVLYPFGKRPLGQISYDDRGNMSTLLMKQDRRRFASSDRRRGTESELREAFEGFDAYFGTYRVDPKKRTVTHHVIGGVYPNWVGSDQLRYLKLEGRRLILSTPPFQLGGRPMRTSCVFEREV